MECLLAFNNLKNHRGMPFNYEKVCEVRESRRILLIFRAQCNNLFYNLRRYQFPFGVLGSARSRNCGVILDEIHLILTIHPWTEEHGTILLVEWPQCVVRFTMANKRAGLHARHISVRFN